MISRRDFLKKAGITGAQLVVGSSIAAGMETSPNPANN